MMHGVAETTCFINNATEVKNISGKQNLEKYLLQLKNLPNISSMSV
jgi:hypothetical protein